MVQILDEANRCDIWRLVIVDDGSTDETKKVLKELIERAPSNFTFEIIDGPGSWYWAKSMHEADLRVKEDSNLVLWLNNDITLKTGAINSALELHRKKPNAVYVGQFLDPMTMMPSYGGFIRSQFNPLKLTRVTGNSSELEIQTFCGNFVLIPNSVRSKTGGIDGKFAHAYADIDYGYRIRSLGFQILLIPEVVGFCKPNESSDNLSRYEIIKEWNSVKQSPIRSQFRFFKRHSPLLWPILTVLPYFRILIFGARRPW